MEKSIIIIGAGMGGLAAGIYAQLNGYRSRIFEMHSLPGGQCASWKRQGYTFDVCIHHLMGCAPGTRINGLWRELGAMPRNLVYTRECVSVASPEGRLFNDYYDLELLEQHLASLAPQDSGAVKEYIGGIKAFARGDAWGALMVGTTWDKLRMAPALLANFQRFKPSMQQFADRFQDPLLRRAFPLLEYSYPDMPLFLHLAKHAYGYQRDIAWPVGGAAAFVRSIEQRYRELGGEAHYQQKVAKILTEHGRAVGVRLEDGSEHRADIVISNADGRKTIMNMLDGRYADKRIRQYCADPPDETNWAVHVFLGVSRDLSNEPSALVLLLDQPVKIADHVYKSLEMQIYGFDGTMASAGKGVIKVELVSTYSYWKKLYSDRSAYEEEKARTAEAVIGLLEKHFPGIRSQIEVVDVPTLMTWERYMGGTHGFVTLPNKKFNMLGSLLGQGLETRLPGLDNFYLAGYWATSVGALFANAMSGKTVVRAICKRDGKAFTAVP